MIPLYLKYYKGFTINDNENVRTLFNRLIFILYFSFLKFLRLKIVVREGVRLGFIRPNLHVLSAFCRGIDWVTHVVTHDSILV